MAKAVAKNRKPEAAKIAFDLFDYYTPEFGQSTEREAKTSALDLMYAYYGTR